MTDLVKYAIRKGYISCETPKSLGGITMKGEEKLKPKEAKILKCVKCGKEYVYDMLSRRCPECGGGLKKETVVR